MYDHDEFGDDVGVDEQSFDQNPAKKLAAFKDWLLTSRMVPTTAQVLLGDRWIERGVVYKAFKESIGYFESTFSDRIKHLALNSIGIDGYDPLTKTLTCADGTTARLYPNELSWKMILVSLFGLPSRPETLDANGYPKYSFLQFLRNMGGGWNPVKEKLKGYKVDEDGKILHKLVEEQVQESGERTRQVAKPINETLTQNRWTEKKRATLIFAVIRVPLFVIFNLVTWPFKLARNLVRAVTEIALPVFSMGVINVNLILNALAKRARGKIMRSPIHFLIFGLVYLALAVTTLAVGVFQYALSLASRIAKAATSPLTNALLAYNSGVLILGKDYSDSWFSRIVGGIGFALSMALSITVWAFTLPLALGALVNAVPALLTPITALAQSPFIANVLAWLTQLPFVTVLSTAFGTAFGVVGGALTATFGAAVASVGAFVGVAIPQVVVAFSLIMSIVVMPAATAVTWGVENLSNAIMQWVEQRPVRTLFAKIGAGINAAVNTMVSGLAATLNKIKGNGDTKEARDPLLDVYSETLLSGQKGAQSGAEEHDLVQSQQPKQSEEEEIQPVRLESKPAHPEKAPKDVYVYRNPVTREYIVSSKALKLGYYQKELDGVVNKALEGVQLISRFDKQDVWDRANYNSDRSSTQQAVFFDDLETQGPAEDGRTYIEFVR